MKITIETSSGILEAEATAYDSDDIKICSVTAGDKYEAMSKLFKILEVEIINIKNNKRKIDFFKTVKRGTKVKYETGNRVTFTKYGYFVKTLEEKGQILVSRIKEDDPFSGITMLNEAVHVDAKLVELVEEV